MSIALGLTWGIAYHILDSKRHKHALELLGKIMKLLLPGFFCLGILGLLIP